MSAPDSLKEIYADEMKDLWSANDQMTRAMKMLVGQAHDAKLKSLLEESVAGIAGHTDETCARMCEQAWMACHFAEWVPSRSQVSQMAAWCSLLA